MLGMTNRQTPTWVNNPWWNKRQVAEYLAVSDTTIERWVVDGKITRYTIPDTMTRRYRADEIKALLTKMTPAR